MGLKEVLANGDGFMFFMFDNVDSCESLRRGTLVHGQPVATPEEVEENDEANKGVCIPDSCVGKIVQCSYGILGL